jgi:hypothetical protein
VESPHTTHLAAGGILLGLGGGGLLTLSIYAATPNAKAWDAIWFLLCGSVSGLFALTGAYLLAASTYLPLPLPRTRYERENAPDLKVKSFTLKLADPVVKADSPVARRNPR